MSDQTEIEDIYRLTELQEALLLHRLQHPKDDGGFLQVRGTLNGKVEDELFSRAWQHTLNRYPTLRSGIQWRDLKHPVQVVARSPESKIKYHDWRDLPESKQHEQFQDLLVKDHKKGLDIETPPAMRFTLARIARRQSLFLWTCHHILLDGWSTALALEELLETYERFRTQSAPPDRPVPSFRHYVAHVRNESLQSEAAHFWKQQALSPTNLFPSPSTPPKNSTPNVLSIPLDSLPPKKIEAWCRQARITTNSFFLGCWTLFLAESLKTQHPVCGLTVSGRAGLNVDEIDSMVGMLANTLPISHPVAPSATLAQSFGDLFKTQQAFQRFEHYPLGRILEWAGVSPRQPLFDTLFVYANYPLDLSASRPSPLKKNLTLTSFESSLTSTYPLTIGVRSGSPFIAEARFQTPRVSPEEATQILERYKNLATDILAAPPQTTVADLLKDPAPFRPRTNPITPATAAVTPPPFEPPASALEAELAGIWLDLIDVDRVGRNDNFFDLGGQSLTIPRLINHIEKTTGANLPLGIIFQAPTLAQLAAAISHAKTRSQTQESTGGVMVEIHAGHSAPALFATAGGVGVEEELLVFGALIPFLPNETPIYGFRSGALDDPPPASFDDLVNRNLKELQERQPIGPYLIAGECISGPIAFEMARRLHNNGHEVARLILLDSKCPQKEDFIRQRDHGLPDLEAVQGPARARQIQNYYLNILGAEHSPYKGAVDLIVSDDSREQFGDSLGWQDYLTGPCRIHKVPGDHDSYIRTHNAEVGRCLNQILRDVLTITSS